MTKRLQRGAGQQTHPGWMRVLALACVLLIGVVSSAQAAHIHGQWLPDHAAKASALADISQAPGGEEHCPLCVAMHSALPVTQRLGLVRLVLVVVGSTQTVNHAPDALWHFAMFSRPPPVLGNA